MPLSMIYTSFAPGTLRHGQKQAKHWLWAKEMENPNEMHPVFQLDDFSGLTYGIFFWLNGYCRREYPLLFITH